LPAHMRDEVLKLRFDPDVEEKRIKQHKVSARNLRKMFGGTKLNPNHAWITYERQDATVEEQGVGVADEDRGAQPVLVLSVKDRRQWQQFQRDVIKPLRNAGLIDARKEYELEETVEQERDLTEAEAELVAVTDEKVELDRLGDDLSWMRHPNFLAQTEDSPEFFIQSMHTLQDCVNAYLTFKEQHPEEEEAQKKPTELSNDDMLNLRPMEAVGAMLLAHDVPIVLEKDEVTPQAVEQFKANFEGFYQAYNEHLAHFRRFVDELRDEVGSLSQLETTEEVIKASYHGDSMYDLDGEERTQGDIDRHFASHAQRDPVHVKFYLKPELMTFFGKGQSTPTAQWMQRQQRNLPTDIERGEGNDAVRQVRTSMRANFAFTPDEIKNLAEPYFAALQSRNTEVGAGK